MSAKFYTLLTEIGAAKLANATALGVPLKITQMAVGDGGGMLPTPNAQQQKLVAEKRRAALNRLYIDPQNNSQIIAEQVIPETEGGWWIREVGLFDEAGALIAVGNCPESYKPQLAEGSGRTQTVRMVLITRSTDNITLKIDPSVVLATRQYTDEQIAEKLTQGLDRLVSHAPEKLDTLKKLADALGNDANFSKTMADKLAEKLDKAKNGADIADKSAFLANLGLGEGSALPVGVPVPWPSALPPTGWLKCNGAAFNKTHYPVLASVYPSGNLPDLRGEFIRGWDDGRGVDGGRVVYSPQGDEFRSHGHRFVNEYGTPTHNFIAYTDQNSENLEIQNIAGWRCHTYIWLENTGGNETRPRNIAFNYIVRAA